MRRYQGLPRTIGVALTIVAMLTLAGSASAASLVDNGDFEEPAIPEGGEPHQAFSAGESFGGWSVAEGSLLVGFTHTDDAPNGRQYVVFNHDPGAASQPVMQQDLATTAGSRYHLRFAYAGDPSIAGQPGCFESQRIKRFGVHWGADPMREYAFDTTGRGSGNFGWTYADLLIDAPSASTQLKFRDLHDGNCGAAFDDVSVDVPPASMSGTSVSAAPSASVYGQPVTLTAKVIAAQPTVTPTGTVQFERDGAPLGSPVTLDASGAAELTTSSTAVGHHAIRAVYEPAAGAALDTSAGNSSLTVDKAATSTAVTVAPSTAVAGQTAQFTAVVRAVAPGGGQPTGNVRFVEDVSGAQVGTPVPLDASGTARLTTTRPAGGHTLRAHYDGNDSHDESYGAATLQVRRAHTATSIVSDANPVPAGGEVTFTVTVTTLDAVGRAPTGAITFTDEGQPITEPIPLDPAGARAGELVVTFEAPSEPLTTTIGAEYGGDADTAPSRGEVRQTISAPLAPALPAPAAPAAALTSDDRASEVAALLTRLGDAIRRRGGGALKAKLRFRAAKPGLLELQVFSRPKGRARKRLLASGTRAFLAAGEVAVRLRPTAAGRRAVRRGRRIPVQAVARYSPLREFAVSVTKRMTIPARKRSRAARARHVASG